VVKQFVSFDNEQIASPAWSGIAMTFNNTFRSGLKVQGLRLVPENPVASFQTRQTPVENSGVDVRPNKSII
jgi:hypothetical protein